MMSCLFRAVGFHVKTDAFVMRQNICNILAQNPTFQGKHMDYWIWWASERNDDYNPHQGVENLCSYVRHMRNPSTYGSGLEIMVFCILYQCRVAVWNIRDGDSQQPILYSPTLDSMKEQQIHDNEKYDHTEQSTHEMPTYEITWTGNHYEPVERNQIHVLQPPTNAENGLHDRNKHSYQTSKRQRRNVMVKQKETKYAHLVSSLLHPGYIRCKNNS